MGARLSNFRMIDRATGYLLPPSVDEWLPERHMARFIVEVIDRLDLSAVSGSYRGTGSASYHPALLLGILWFTATPRECFPVGSWSGRPTIR
jgi:transposase